jgi:signal transduction histidine kinase
MELSTSKSIIEAHGGQISATANSPHGAIVGFRLPRASDGTVAPVPLTPS